HRRVANLAEVSLFLFFPWLPVLTRIFACKASECISNFNTSKHLKSICRNKFKRKTILKNNHRTKITIKKKKQNYVGSLAFSKSATRRCNRSHSVIKLCFSSISNPTCLSKSWHC